MLRSLIHSPRRRGLLGALLLGSAPYMVAASNHGMFLGFDAGGWMFVMVTGCILALFGFGVFHGGGAQSGVDAVALSDNWDATDRDRYDLVHQNGLHTSTRDLWDNNYR